MGRVWTSQTFRESMIPARAPSLCTTSNHHSCHISNPIPPLNAPPVSVSMSAAAAAETMSLLLQRHQREAQALIATLPSPLRDALATCTTVAQVTEAMQTHYHQHRHSPAAPAAQRAAAAKIAEINAMDCCQALRRYNASVALHSAAKAAQPYSGACAFKIDPSVACTVIGHAAEAAEMFHVDEVLAASLYEHETTLAARTAAAEQVSRDAAVAARLAEEERRRTKQVSDDAAAAARLVEEETRRMKQVSDDAALATRLAEEL